MRRWVYRTILFEFQRDKLLGDKYINDEEVEKTLNEQGTRGWELVGVTTTQEGLLAICKRPDGLQADDEDHDAPASASEPDCDAVEKEDVVSASALKERERAHIMELEARRRQAMQQLEEEQDQDLVGRIRIF
ncbi:hypothetical protein [Desulfolithobacter sp.]